MEAIKDSTSDEYVKLYNAVEEMFNSNNPILAYEKHSKFYDKFGVFDIARGDQGKVKEFFEF